MAGGGRHCRRQLDGGANQGSVPGRMANPSSQKRCGDVIIEWCRWRATYTGNEFGSTMHGAKFAEWGSRRTRQIPPLSFRCGRATSARHLPDARHGCGTAHLDPGLRNDRGDPGSAARFRSRSEPTGPALVKVPPSCVGPITGNDRDASSAARVGRSGPEFVVRDRPRTVPGWLAHVVRLDRPVGWRSSRGPGSEQTSRPGSSEPALITIDRPPALGGHQHVQLRAVGRPQDIGGLRDGQRHPPSMDGVVQV